MESPNAILETPLRHAVIGSQVEVLKVLHERGAAFTVKDNIGCTAFHDAILVNAHECLDFLLGLRARVDQKYLTTGQTALHLLAEDADLRTLKIFLKQAHTGLGRLEITARDAKNFTALEYLNLRHDDDDSEFKNAFHLLLKKVEAAHSLSRPSHFDVFNAQQESIDPLIEDDESENFTDALEAQLFD
jgi:ankyrin repeat protein